MQVEARISKEWRRRMVLMGFMIYGSALWFLYDGYIAWPAEADRHVELLALTEELVAAGEAVDGKDPAVERAWARLAAERKWSEKVPKNRTRGDLLGQRITGGIMLAGGLIFTAWVLWNHRRSVRCDGDLITGASGERVHFDQIVETDRRKWNSKGIAYAIYEANGRRRRLTLDDHKFLGAEAILLEAERRLAARKAVPDAAAGHEAKSSGSPA
jgi:hypothetical protein